MRRTSRWFIRPTAGIVAAVVALALGVAPPAWASTTTITAAAGVQFNGVVDTTPACLAGSASINWGDGSAPSSGRLGSSGQVIGTHAYGGAGTFGGTVTLTGGGCRTAMVDNLTANVGATPQFTECPQVGVDVGCQFLIDVTPSGVTVLQDTTQGPYESSEDALIGVKNDSSAPLSSIPISTPNSDVFGFEGDGLCDPGSGPLPAGCQLIGSPGTPCDPSAFQECAFPPVPGQPGPNPSAYTGSTQNGYEGPRNYYSNVASTLDKGVVNFSPALKPGESTYFSLEEPPGVNAINVGSTPTGGGFTAPPTVTATSASFVAIVNPNGAATTAQFQFNLDPSYSALASFNQSTPAQSVGGDFADHLVSATVQGLVPNALYHVRLVANNKNGQTVGPDVTFTTELAPPPGPPTLGRTFNLQPVSGIVLVKIHGVFQPLTQVRQFPTNTVVDALGATLRLITAVPGHPAADAAAKPKKGKGKKTKIKAQTGTFGGAIFKVSQASNGLATLTLVENAFKGGPSYSTCKAKAADASAAALSSKTLQLLRSNARGKFSTKGKYGAATVRGTEWTIADKCNGTLIHDVTHSVAVNDFVRHKTIILHAGQSYLAKARLKK